MPDNRGDPMSILDSDFIKDRYDFELARKQSLTGALADKVGLDPSEFQRRTTAQPLPKCAAFRRITG